MTAQGFYLLKSEPDVYSIDDLIRDGKTHWDHVRNFQARNVLKSMKKGDLAWIYHSNIGKEIVGLAEVVREAYPEPKDPDWVQVDLKPVLKLPNPVALATLKADPLLKNMTLIRQSRLSCMSVTPAEAKKIASLGGLKTWKP